MLKRLFNLWAPEGLEEVRANKDQSAAFELCYGNTHVGMLRLQHGQWQFEYSNEYRSTQKLHTIVDFPDKNKRYTSEVLWPYFTSRIPTLEQPSVRHKLSKEGVSPNDEVGLLRLFGKRTITNPFELHMVAL